MGRCPILRKSERPGELSLNWKYSHNSGYVTGGGKLAKKKASPSLGCHHVTLRRGTDFPEEHVTSIYPGDAGNRFF
jgi:hypothetical protein